MKKNISRALALAMVAALTLTGCGGGNGESGNNEGSGFAKNENTDAIKDLVITKAATRELETFNILYSQRAEDGENLCNLVDGLLESNPAGELVPCIAKEWSSEDGGKTWTFNLRDDVKWVDMNGAEKAATTAQDFATGLEWVLNFYKNDSANTAMPLEMIEGATEYYEWTKTLSEDEALALTAGDGSKFREMVKMETPDDYTVVYHCNSQMPYFPSVATYGCLYPMSQAMVDELGGPKNVKSMNNENMWYNGPYTMTSYVQGNEKIFTKNPLYWDTECTLFDTVTFKMVESGDLTWQYWENEEIDYAPLGEARLNEINKPDNKWHDYLVPDVESKYSYQWHWNFNKLKEDGTPDENWNKAVANTAFRKAFYYGFDMVDYWKRTNALTPMVVENNFYTMKGLCFTSDGTDYVELVRKELGLPVENGETPVRLDKEKAEQYKKQAMEELSAIGVTFPVQIDHYIPGSNQTSLDSANVLKQTIANSFGTDFVELNIKTYVQSVRKEVITPHLHSWTNNGWGADYADPQNYLGQETYGGDNAYYSENYSFINDITEPADYQTELVDIYKEYSKMVDEANAITDDMDARYAAYAKAEAYMLDNVLVLPANYQVGWCLSKIDNDTRMFAKFGGVNDKMKNWVTKTTPYTTAEKVGTIG
jgi:oligopeptide transport system substrate-binding protein